MEMSLSQAAQAAKRTRQCLASAIKKGRLAASRDANGEWRIDSAELVRVYPDCNPLQQTASPSEQVLDGTFAIEVAVLRERLAASEALRHAEEERRREAEARLAKAERDLDAERERFDNYIRALPVGQASSPAQSGPGIDERGPGNVEAPTRMKRGFWRSIFGGAGNGEKA